MPEEDIYAWMAKQKFPLDRAGVEKVSTAQLAQLRAAGIKYVIILGAQPGECCEASEAINCGCGKDGLKMEIEFATPLPLPGCDKKHCPCEYGATE